MRRTILALLLAPVPAWAVPTLLPPTAPVAGCPVELRVAGLAPGERAVVEVSASGPGGPTCLTSPVAGCVDLDAPVLAGRGVADADGRVRFSRVLPASAPPSSWMQALGQGSGTSAVVRLDLLPDTTDTDGDGLLDVTECAAGTDRMRPDTDGDLLPDGAEDAWGTDPTRADTDDDGLVDGLDPWPLVATDDRGAPDAERLLSPAGSAMLDPEVEPGGHRLVWQDPATTEAWLGGLDPATGTLVPADGRGVRLGAGVAAMNTSANGPEWATAATGARVIWTAEGGGRTWLEQAVETPTGWVTAALPGTDGAVQVSGSAVAGDPEPWIAYRSAGQTASRARMLDDAATDVLVPGGPQNMHWAGHLLVGSIPDAAGRALQGWDADDGGATVLAEPSGATTPDGWWVPLAERPDETVLVTSRRLPDAPRSEVAVYRLTSGALQEALVFPAPPALPWIWSPEPFTWRGRTYVVFAVNTAETWGEPTEGQVWLASIDPRSPVVFRRVCGSALRQRNDPEAYAAGASPWIWFTTRRHGVPSVYRCDPGL